jgi:hypothetical protein
MMIVEKPRPEVNEPEVIAQTLLDALNKQVIYTPADHALAVAAQKFLFSRRWLGEVPPTGLNALVSRLWSFYLAQTKMFEDLSNLAQNERFEGRWVAWKGAKIRLICRKEQQHDTHKTEVVCYELLAGKLPPDNVLIAIADRRVPGPQDLSLGYISNGHVIKEGTRAVVNLWRS